MSKKIETKNVCDISFSEMLKFNVKNELTASDSRMLMCLFANYDHEKKFAAIRQEDICKQVGLSLSSVRGSTGRLKEKRIIKVAKNQDGGIKHVFNNYYINKKLYKWFKKDERDGMPEQVV